MNAKPYFHRRQLNYILTIACVLFSVVAELAAADEPCTIIISLREKVKTLYTGNALAEMVRAPLNTASIAQIDIVRGLIRDFEVASEKTNVTAPCAFEAHYQIAYLSLKLAAAYQNMVSNDARGNDPIQKWRLAVEDALTSIKKARSLTGADEKESVWLNNTERRARMAYYASLAYAAKWTLGGGQTERELALKEWNEAQKGLPVSEGAFPPSFPEEIRYKVNPDLKPAVNNYNLHLAAAGVAMMFVVLGVALIKKDPNRLVELIVRTILAVGVGYAGTVLLGTLDLKIQQIGTATGTVALVIFIYRFNPGWIPPDRPKMPPAVSSEKQGTN